MSVPGHIKLHQGTGDKKYDSFRRGNNLFVRGGKGGDLQRSRANCHLQFFFIIFSFFASILDLKKV